MIERTMYLERLETAVKRSPITSLLGPRQVGKTTLARRFAEKRPSTFFDLELDIDRRRLQNPMMALGALDGLVVLDEIQTMPELFNQLRVLVDRPQNRAKFLILGSASPEIIKKVSQTLAGRVEFVDLPGLRAPELPAQESRRLWVRGGFPRSFLAASTDDSMMWRNGFIRTFLERDIAQFGFRIPSPAMRRFWTMLAHYHGQTWNGAKIARAMDVSGKTARTYLDILSGTYMVRQLQPWFVNVGKRQVKSPKVYLRDSGLLHSLLNISDWDGLLAHPTVGASWEGFVLEQIIYTLQLYGGDVYFWATHNGAELDVLFFRNGRSYGIEIKFKEAPKVTKSMNIAIETLGLTHLWVVYPGMHIYPASDKITMLPLSEIAQLPSLI